MDKSGRQETAETQSGNDDCGSGSWRQWTLAATADDDSGGQQRRWMTKAADDDGM
jgi:hypothetical protein